MIHRRLIPTLIITLALVHAQTTSAAGPAPLTLSSQTVEQTDLSRHLATQVSYPVAAGTDDAARTFNSLAQQIPNSVIAAFVQDLQSDSALTEALGVSNTVLGGYDVLSNKAIVSVRYNMSTYLAGAAHPASFTRMLNYDPARHGDLALHDLFKPGVSYLRALSSYCAPLLRRRHRLDFPEGAAPVEANYAQWGVKRGVLLIHFDPSQVAPYAAGRQECAVPARRLARLLHPGAAAYFR